MRMTVLRIGIVNVRQRSSPHSNAHIGADGIQTVYHVPWQRLDGRVGIGMVKPIDRRKRSVGGVRGVGGGT